MTSPRPLVPPPLHPPFDDIHPAALHFPVMDMPLALVSARVLRVLLLADVGPRRRLQHKAALVRGMDTDLRGAIRRRRVQVEPRVHGLSCEAQVQIAVRRRRRHDVRRVRSVSGTAR